MLEVLLITGTQIVEPRFAIGRACEAEARTLTMTSLEPRALAALCRQGVTLEAAEGILLGAICHLRQTFPQKVAKPVLGEHKVVAGIQVAIVLHHHGMPALLGIGAYARLHAHPSCQGGIENLYKHLAHVMPHPLIEERT